MTIRDGLTAGQMLIEVAGIGCDLGETVPDVFIEFGAWLDRDHGLGLMSDNDRRHVIAKTLAIVMDADDIPRACRRAAHWIDSTPEGAEPLDNPIMCADALRRIADLLA
jgi:hypothetical protein